MSKAHDMPPFSHPVAVATLHGETHLKLAADEAARARIAGALDLDGVTALAAEFLILQASNGLVTVTGRLSGSVRPVCVLTAEAFDQAIDEEIALKFAPEPLIARMTKRAEDDQDEDFEPPDLIENGSIDFGAVMTEFLALALDPYPKKPGAAFAGLSDPVPARVSPFEALKALKTPDKE